MCSINMKMKEQSIFMLENKVKTKPVKKDFYWIFSLPQISTNQNGQIPQSWSTFLSSSSLICFQNLTLPHFQPVYFSKMSLLSDLLGHFSLILFRLPGGSKKSYISLFTDFLLFCICHIFMFRFWSSLFITTYTAVLSCLFLFPSFLFLSFPFLPFSFFSFSFIQHFSLLSSSVFFL